VYRRTSSLSTFKRREFEGDRAAAAGFLRGTSRVGGRRPADLCQRAFEKANLPHQAVFMFAFAKKTKAKLSQRVIAAPTMRFEKKKKQPAFLSAITTEGREEGRSRGATRGESKQAGRPTTHHEASTHSGERSMGLWEDTPGNFGWRESESVPS